MTTSQISVVIPTYNRADFLKEAIESALGQTYRPIEVIVVDDGSTDHTRAICELFGDRIRYIYRDNDGTRGNGARALAIRESRGEWVALHDHDDRWLPTKIEEQLAAVADKPEVGIVFTGAVVIDGEGKRTGETFAPGPSGDVFHEMLRGQRYCASSALVRKEAIEYARRTLPGRDILVDTEYWNNDTDLWIRIASKYQVLFLEKQLTEYRYYGGNDGSDQVRLMNTDIVMLRDKLSLLHERCNDCKRSYADGISQLTRRLAIAHFDHYIRSVNSRSGKLDDLFSAINTRPALFLHPHRFCVTIKYLVLDLMNRLHLR